MSVNMIGHEAVRKDCTCEASGLFQKMRFDTCDEICLDKERTPIQRAGRDEIAMAADVVEGAESLGARHVGRANAISSPSRHRKAHVIGTAEAVPYDAFLEARYVQGIAK